MTKSVKIFFKLLTCCLVTFVCFNTACTNLNISSGKNFSENGAVPATKKTPVIIDGRLINETGWKIPQAKDARTGPPIVKKIDTVEGKPFNVKIHSFIPIDKVLYTEELFSENVTRLHGELVLDLYKEYRLNDQVYLYSIVAKENESIDQKNINDHNDKLIYQILDNNGDGIFETLIDNSDTVLIPKWVTK
jgi:hypothetical protein